MPVQVLACEREVYDWIPVQASAREIVERLAFWRENLRDLWGVDVAGYEWPSASLTTLTLLLADRHRGSEACGSAADGRCCAAFA